MTLSPREQKFYNYLDICKCYGATTFELQKALNNCAVGSTAGDLRKKGIKVISKQSGRIFRYWLALYYGDKIND